MTETGKRNEVLNMLSKKISDHLSRREYEEAAVLAGVFQRTRHSDVGSDLAVKVLNEMEEVLLGMGDVDSYWEREDLYVLSQILQQVQMV